MHPRVTVYNEVCVQSSQICHNAISMADRLAGLATNKIIKVFLIKRDQFDNS